MRELFRAQSSFNVRVRGAIAAITFAYAFGLLVTFGSSQSTTSVTSSCDPLSYRIGVKINCEHPVTRETINCKSDRAPVGTTASYKCDDGYVPITQSPPQGPGEDDDHILGQVKCNSQGEWSPRNSLHGFSCQIDCGRPGRITHWPWHASIFSRRSERDGFRFLCGGTLINPGRKGFAILTATSCFSEHSSAFSSTRTPAPANLRVALGLTSPEFAQVEESNYARVYRVKQIANEPRGRDRGLTLLSLEEDVILDETVAPICLSASSSSPTSWEAAQLVGFGQDAQDGLTSPSLRKVNLAPKGCQASTAKARSNFCLEAKGRGDICSGDIGGGLIAPIGTSCNREGSNIPIRYSIQGVLTELDESRGSGGGGAGTGQFSQLSGSGSAAVTDCSRSAVFAYVTNYTYTSWISEQVDRFNSGDDETVAQIVNVLPEETTTIRLAFHRETPPPPPSTPQPKPPRRTSTSTITHTPIIPPTTESQPSAPAVHGPAVSGSNSNSRLPRPRPTISPTSSPSPSRRTTTAEPSFVSRNPSDFQQVGLDWHNFYRRRHGVPEVSLSVPLSDQAQEEAELWLKNHRHEFSGVTNWFATTRANLDAPTAAKQAVRDWYKSMSAYNFTTTEPTSVPFTHIVWKSTSEVGIGVARRGHEQIVVAKYLRPLFFEHVAAAAFQENVLPAQPDL